MISHYTTVFVRSDWADDGLAPAPRLLGILHAGQTKLSIARDGNFARGFRSVVALGAEHITSGTDHLMFLFARLLAAPLFAEGGRWTRHRDLRDTAVAIARIITAFTIGHWLTLALGTLGRLALPTTMIEAAIAVSIMVTALHTMRPIFPRREALVAGTFGLVHGLAFASSLPQRDLGRAQTAWTLVGFNLGIALVELALLLRPPQKVRVPQS